MAGISGSSLRRAGLLTPEAERRRPCASFPARARSLVTPKGVAGSRSAEWSRPTTADSARGLVVVTGSELVRGGRRDANGPFLAEELTAARSRAGASHARRRRARGAGGGPPRGPLGRPLVVSGGLGPTHDDRTVELLARAAGRPRRSTPSSSRRSRRSRGGRGAPPAALRGFDAGVTKQATVPEGGLSLGSQAPRPASLSSTGRRGRRPARAPRPSCAASGRPRWQEGR